MDRVELQYNVLKQLISYSESLIPALQNLIEELRGEERDDTSDYLNEVISGIMLTLVIGGALAGIGAAFLYLTGYEQWSVTQTSVPGMGFNGIAATFLGGLHPIGTIFSSYFIQHITSGGAFLDKNVYPSQISDLISAVIIYLCGFVLFFKLFLNKRHSSKKGGTSK